MRIAISGTANVGKTTLVQDFLKRWPNFKTTTGSYRDKLDPNNHSSKTTPEVQRAILDWFVEQYKQFGPEDNVIYDRCTLDNLVYTFWCVHNEKFDSKFADECIPIVRESLRNLDVIFYIPFDESIQIINDGTREADAGYIREVDAFFRVMYEDYLKGNEETFLIFPKDDMPAIIPISGSREQRLAQIGEYIDPQGEVVTTNPDTSVFSEDNLKQMEEFVKLQEDLYRREKFGVD
jgi:hypothetical protein